MKNSFRLLLTALACVVVLGVAVPKAFAIPPVQVAGWNWWYNNYTPAGYGCVTDSGDNNFSATYYVPPILDVYQALKGSCTSTQCFWDVQHQGPQTIGEPPGPWVHSYTLRCNYAFGQSSCTTLP